MCTKRKDFTEDPKEEILENQGFRAREASHLCYYASRGRDSSNLVYSSLFGQKIGVSSSNSMFFAKVNWASPRRRHISSLGSLALHLGEGVRLREGVVHLSEGVVHQSKPRSRFLCGTSPPRRVILRLSEPKRSCYRLLGDCVMLVCGLLYSLFKGYCWLFCGHVTCHIWP